MIVLQNKIKQHATLHVEQSKSPGKVVGASYWGDKGEGHHPVFCLFVFSFQNFCFLLVAERAAAWCLLAPGGSSFLFLGGVENGY